MLQLGSFLFHLWIVKTNSSFTKAHGSVDSEVAGTFTTMFGTLASGRFHSKGTWLDPMFREQIRIIWRSFSYRRPYFGGVKFGLVIFVPGVVDETRITTGFTLDDQRLWYRWKSCNYCCSDESMLVMWQVTKGACSFYQWTDTWYKRSLCSKVSLFHFWKRHLIVHAAIHSWNLVHLWWSCSFMIRVLAVCSFSFCFMSMSLYMQV